MGGRIGAAPARATVTARSFGCAEVEGVGLGVVGLEGSSSELVGVIRFVATDARTYDVGLVADLDLVAHSLPHPLAPTPASRRVARPLS